MSERNPRPENIQSRIHILKAQVTGNSLCLIGLVDERSLSGRRTDVMASNFDVARLTLSARSIGYASNQGETKCIYLSSNTLEG